MSANLRLDIGVGLEGEPQLISQIEAGDYIRVKVFYVNDNVMLPLAYIHYHVYRGIAVPTRLDGREEALTKKPYKEGVMERKPTVMLCLKMCLMKIIILFCSTASALAANVELGNVGDDAPNYLWCRCKFHKITPGSDFRVTFRGRSTNGSTQSGVIGLDPASGNYFRWKNYSTDPTLIFTPEMNILTYSTPRQLLVKPTTPIGLYYVKFMASDASGVTSERIQGCLVEVVKELPDVEVVDLKYDPPLPRTSYYTIRMTIRNNAQYSSLLSVPWSISILKRMGGPGGYQTQVLGSGVINNLIPGHLYEVTAEDRFFRGGVSFSDKIYGDVDRNNFIGENETERTNNWKEIPRKSLPAPPRLVEQDLDSFKAQNNGAQFRDNIEGDIPPACIKIGVGDWHDPNWSPPEGRKFGVLFQADCQLSGGKANPEAFVGFRLKNGWKVKSVDDPDFVRQSPVFGPLPKTTGFELNTKPEVGSDSLYIKAHIWANPASYISVGIRIVIEGPEGTDPYRDSNCPSDCTLRDSICLKGSPPAGPRFRCNTNYDCAAGYACGDDNICHQVCNP